MPLETALNTHLMNVSMRKIKEINEIIVHCSDTKITQSFDISDIRRWHTDPKPKGNGWSDVGYHYYIKLNGVIQKGRDLDVTGAHVRGRNRKTVGICFEGGKDQYGEMWSGPNPSQVLSFRTLKASIDLIVGKELPIAGHRKYDSRKSCPNFNVKNLL